MSGIVNKEELDKPVPSDPGEPILERTTEKLLLTKFTEAKVMQMILKMKNNFFLQWTDSSWMNSHNGICVVNYSY